MKFNRIYINNHLAENIKLELGSDHTHYIKTVLRLKVNDQFRIFNGTDGEFLAQIAKLDRNNLAITIQECLRKPCAESSLTLAMSVIKQDKLMLAINMATQLGVTKIVPLITERCQFRSVNIERLTKCVIEATEQSERLNPPVIEPAISIQNYLKKNNNFVLYANEHEKEENSILKLNKDITNISIVIGPEGGFTNDEIALLASYKNAYSISLGKNILRAETAAIAALAQVNLVR
ncbi:MAG: 16S rRNA (uracil(1498)-N(3))-methyltransferase [Rickettsia endosymbiont of Stiretrus anchorago]|nr:16S rRNA (uracil(1498)-N(3))-methyltransferase [Rickettsia endosymbiont of Stiretrus anchorago]